jgi:hypothetical protein
MHAEAHVLSIKSSPSSRAIPIRKAADIKTAQTKSAQKNGFEKNTNVAINSDVASR